MNLTNYVNAAGISAADLPHAVVEKLQRAIDAAMEPSDDAKRLDFVEQKAATVYCSESGHWVFVDERTKIRRGVLGASLRGCIDAAMKEAK